MQVTLIGSEIDNNLTNYKKVAAASTNATSIKAKSGKIASATFVNTSATIKYVKFYDKATAPTVGTDIPIFTVAIPPTNTVSPCITCGIHFDLGIAFAITGLGTDADATAVAANDVIINLQYA